MIISYVSILTLSPLFTKCILFMLRFTILSAVMYLLYLVLALRTNSFNVLELLCPTSFYYLDFDANIQAHNQMFH